MKKTGKIRAKFPAHRRDFWPEPLLKIAGLLGIKTKVDKDGLRSITLPKGLSENVKKQLMALNGKNGVTIKVESDAPKRVQIKFGQRIKPRKEDGYEFEEILIDLPDYDCDLRIKTPSMGTMIFQHRIEGPSVDICLTEPKVAYLQDSDLSPGKTRKGLPSHARVTEQITIV